jgi:hypothetical protein
MVVIHIFKINNLYQGAALKVISSGHYRSPTKKYLLKAIMEYNIY